MPETNKDPRANAPANSGERARAVLMEASQNAQELRARRALEQEENKKPPVRILGYENDALVLYSPRYHRTAKLMPNQLKRDYLLRLATLEQWRAWLFGDDLPKGKEPTEGQIFKDAQSRLIEETGSRRYNPQKIRKLGVWQTKEGIIYNAGDACFLLPAGAAEGSLPVQVEPCRPDGTIFDAGNELPHPAAAALSDDEARHVKAFIAACNWTEPYAAELLAGWIPCAILGGVLKYRPNIWINAERGCGKSTLCKTLGCILGGDENTAGNGGLAVMLAGGGTTDAAFRREMGNTTRAAIFDETEAESEKERSRIATILQYIRLAIDGLASKICGQNNTVENFAMMSCYLLASIRNTLFKPADETRFVVLTMRRVKEKNELARMLKRQRDLQRRFPADLAEKLITRCLKHAAMMKENAAAIADELLRYGLEGRASDKLGHLLAGAWLMEHATPVTPQYLEKCKATAAAAVKGEQTESDGSRCMRVLLDKTAPTRHRTIGELARAVVTNQPAAADEPKKELARYGCAVYTYSGTKHPSAEGKLFLRVLLSNPNFKGLFDGTDWQGGKVKKILLTLDGVLEHAARTNGGNPEPCLLIPKSYWNTDPAANSAAVEEAP